MPMLLKAHNDSLLLLFIIILVSQNTEIQFFSLKQVSVMLLDIETLCLSF